MARGYKKIKHFDEKLDDAEIERRCAVLLEWMQDNGFVNSMQLKIQNTEFGRGIFASVPIKKGDTVLHVPSNLILSSDSVVGPDNAFGNLVRSKVSNILQTISLFLLYEKFVQGPKSFWAPWLDLLPTPKECSVTLFFKPLEMKELEGSWLYDLTDSCLDSLAEQYNEYRHLFEIDGVISDEISLKHYKWAVAMAWSRCFQLKRPYTAEERAKIQKEKEEKEKNKEKKKKADDDSDSEDDEEDDPLRRTLGFMPFTDMFNFKQDPDTWGELDESGLYYRVFSTADTPAGGEIYFHYGEKGNREFLLDYGFTIKNNRYTNVPLDVCISKVDPFRKEKKALLKSELNNEPYQNNDLGRWFEAEVLRTDPYDPEQPPPEQDSKNPDDPRDTCESMKLFRIVNITTEAELEQAKISLEYLSLENEYYSLDQFKRLCLAALKKYPTTIEEDEAKLKTKLSFNVYNAVFLRKEEKELLNRIVANIDTKIHALFNGGHYTDYYKSLHKK